MPTLNNARHEKVAQEKARGDKTNVQAYEAAGYVPNDSHASRLVGNGKVKSRIEEIMVEAAKAASLTRSDIMRQMQRQVLKAEEAGQHSAAIRGSELLGKEVAGMFVERREISTPQDTEFAKLSPEEMREKMRALASELGLDAKPAD
jgi:hypothetical protein